MATNGILGGLTGGNLLGGLSSGSILSMPIITVTLVDKSSGQSIPGHVKMSGGLGLISYAEGDTVLVSVSATVQDYQFTGNVRRGLLTIVATASGYKDQTLRQFNMADADMQIEMERA